MSEKVCSHHKSKKKKAVRTCLAVVAVVVFLALLTILIVWAVLQPKKPRFSVQDATVFVLNVSAPNVISTTIQITVLSRNPNSRIGVYYGKLFVYANYNNQQISYYTVIPPTYQGHKDLNIWSPFIYGTNVPVAPYNGLRLAQDQSAGAVRINFKIDGRVKWKVATFVSGRYHLHVTCPVTIPLPGSPGKPAGVVVGNNAVKYQLSQTCTVSV
ncbi:NDR1/HIN1-like protein 1 [Andrographis paniculata]|uniref:NDR1/HIN1-like protein 1 n=1 Tax=Andrographis paniculata TaxID=175694 RepID=UPI0021E7D8DE|nr:NDR1/HIN1-like protein 1 [Andrographis paniculata]